MPNSIALPVIAVVGVLLVAGVLLFRRPRPATPAPELNWVVVTAPGPTRGLGRIASQGDSATIVVEGNGWRLGLPRDQIQASTRPLLNAAQAEARLTELSKPSAAPTAHRVEQHIRFTKTISKGTDDEVIALLRQLYARPHALTFGDRKMLDMLEQRIVPELAHVLGRVSAAIVESVRSHHAVSSATSAPPEETTWPGKGTPDGVPPLKGLDPLGVVEFKKRLLIGQRLDRYAEPDAGIVAVDVQPGTWNAWLQHNPDDDESIDALVLMRAGAESRWPLQLREVGVVHPWQLAPQADLQVIDDESVSEERVIDAARYLGGTNVYWRRAVTVSNGDGWPQDISILSSAEPSGALDVVVVKTRSEDVEE